MGWLRWVGALMLQVSFAKEPNKRDYILRKRLVILRSLLIVATPYCEPWVDWHFDQKEENKHSIRANRLCGHSKVKWFVPVSYESLVPAESMDLKVLCYKTSYVISGSPGYHVSSGPRTLRWRLAIYPEGVFECTDCWRGGGLGSSTIFKKFNEPYAPS